VEEVELDAEKGEVAEQLRARFNPRHYRLDIRQAPVMRAVIAHDASNDRWMLLHLFHHLALDHTTVEILLQEIQAHLLSQTSQLSTPLSFRNYVAQARLGVSREEHEAFFRKMLGDVDEPTLPFGLVDVRGDGADITEAWREVSKPLASRLRARARALGVSAASLYHLAWAQVLARLSGRDDVIFGTVMFGRMQGGKGVDRVLGLFINTLPVRIRVEGRGVQESVRETHRLLAQLLRHEHAPLALAQRCSAVAAPSPLFSAILNYRHGAPAGREGDVAESPLRAWEGIEVLGSEERTNYPLCLNIDDLGSDFALNAQARSPIDPERICAYMHTALEQLVEALENAPATSLHNLDVLPAQERHRLLVQWNATQADYPSDKCIQHLFEAQVARAPEAVAVVDEDNHLTYGALNTRANRLAHRLCQLGVKPDERVALCVERSMEAVVGLLAVLKAGGAYVPLDPTYPIQRLTYMLADSAPVAVLTQALISEKLSLALAGLSAAVPVIDLETGSETQARHTENNPDRAGIGLTSAHLAYVIYTSGSTGIPKGVAIEHRNAVNFICWGQSAFNLDVLERTLFSTSLNFDLSVYECFVPLSAGATIWIVRSVLDLHQSAADVTLINTVPSAISALVDVGRVPDTVRTINLAGEPLKRELVERIFASTEVDTVCNLYGPSETTTYSTWIGISKEEPFASDIGRPIANTRIYILDHRLQPAPVNVTGEIYIGGAGVARGYLQRPELVAERFVLDPFVGEPGARMYKTGDLGRYRADGRIEFLGRNDFQVKIRGFRIELGEIETCLTQLPAIREAVVVAREDHPGAKRLVAYYTLVQEGDTEPTISDDAVIDAEALQAHLSVRLPEYMVPAAYVELDALPLTTNGKLDRRALPAPEGKAYTKRDYEPPVGEIEIALARIWADLLNLERVGRHDNFFELGGHSLLAMSLIECMRREGLQTEIRALFASPTLAELAAAMEDMEISL